MNDIIRKRRRRKAEEGGREKIIRFTSKGSVKKNVIIGKNKQIIMIIIK